MIPLFRARNDWKSLLCCGFLAASLLPVAAVPPTTLRDDLIDEIDSRLVAAGSPSDTSMSILSRADDVVCRYTRNPAVWTRDIDLSAIGIHTSTSGPIGGSKQIGTLITPADILVANHYKLNIGDKCAFVDNHNVTYVATIIAVANATGDLTVEHVTWPRKVPTTLGIMPILPPDYRRYDRYHELTNFPVLCTNQRRQVFVQNSARADPFMEGLFFHGTAWDPTPLRLLYSMSVISGDSSQPIMAVIRGKAVLITCNTTSAWGVSCPDAFAAINRTLATMGSRWRATVADLRGFPTY